MKGAKKKGLTVHEYKETACDGKYPCGECPRKVKAECSTWRTCPPYRAWLEQELRTIRRLFGKEPGVR